MMNFVTLLKAVDAAIALRAAAKQFKGFSRGSAPTQPGDAMVSTPSAGQGIGGPIEARLTNVLVAALKEAFDRDRARLDLERIQIEEQRRRAEEASRLELRRQSADRELGRLRLLAGTAMVGWIASVVMVGARLAGMSTPARAAIAAGWLLLLGAIGAAFSAQGRINAESDSSGSSTAALWLLITGLAVTTLSLLF